VSDEVAVSPGERRIWEGKPDPHVLFIPADFYLIPISVLFTGFSVVWLMAAVRQVSPVQIPFGVVGAAFVAYGLYLMVGRFFVKTFRKRRTRYVLTSRRAIVIRPRRQFEADLASMATRHVRIHGQYMDVTFGVNDGFNLFFRLVPNSGVEAMGIPVAFYDVADVDGLRAALSELNTVEFRHS